MLVSINKIKQFFTKRAFLEGGKKTKVNMDFRNASNAPFESLVNADRETIRARARWLESNNPVMDNIDKAIINNVIGRGIKLNVKNKRIEKQWNNFCKSPEISGRMNFTDMCRMILKRRMVDGEIFINMITTQDGLKLQVIEADRLSTMQNKLGMNINPSTGEVESYQFKKTDKSDQLSSAQVGEVITVASDDIINYFVASRPTQYRGVSEYSQVILDIKNLSAYSSATIESKRASANIAYAVKSDSNPNSFGANIDDDGEQIQDINGASVFYLGMGEDISKLDHSGDGVSYREFTEAGIRNIAVGRNISYELANRDYSKTNFSSAKASILQDHRRFDYEQEHLTEYVLNVIYERWYEIERLRGNIIKEYEEPEWNYPKREFVDPVKDMAEIEKKLQLRITSLSDVIKETTGRDFESVLKQIKADKELMEKYDVEEYDIQMQVLKNPENPENEGEEE